jgi:hypothetical protein
LPWSKVTWIRPVNINVRRNKAHQPLPASPRLSAKQLTAHHAANEAFPLSDQAMRARISTMPPLSNPSPVRSIPIKAVNLLLPPVPATTTFLSSTTTTATEYLLKLCAVARPVYPCRLSLCARSPRNRRPAPLTPLLRQRVLYSTKNVPLRLGY